MQVRGVRGRMQRVSTVGKMDGRSLLEAFRSVIPQETFSSYKGQSGRIAVVGGSTEWVSTHSRTTIGQLSTTPTRGVQLQCWVVCSSLLHPPPTPKCLRLLTCIISPLCSWPRYTGAPYFAAMSAMRAVSSLLRLNIIILHVCVYMCTQCCTILSVCTSVRECVDKAILSI